MNKEHISKVIKLKMKENKLSLRKLADMIDDMSYTQIARITSCGNYTIDTLIKVLDALGLSISIITKEEE